MGAACSITSVQEILQSPIDCSDVADADAARAEVGRVRNLIGELAVIGNLFAAMDWEKTGLLSATRISNWLRAAPSSKYRTQMCVRTFDAWAECDAYDGDEISYARWIAFWVSEKDEEGDITETLRCVVCFFDGDERELTRWHFFLHASSCPSFSLSLSLSLSFAAGLSKFSTTWRQRVSQSFLILSTSTGAGRW